MELQAWSTGLQRRIASAGFRGVLRFARRNPLASFWGVVAVLLILMAIAAPIVAPYRPTAVDTKKMRAPPDSDNVFGTDSIGRDILSRLVYGGRVSLFVALASVSLGTTIGLAWGIAGGYFGGRVDLISERVVEVMMAIPGLILAMILVVALGATVWTIIIAIAVTRAPFAERVVRSVVLSVKETPYIEAARAIGASNLRVMVFHVGPQTVATYIVLLTINLGTAILIEAALSFLGLGVRPPTATWGGMLGEASALFYPHWWMVVFPGIFITVAVMAFNLFGDGLRNELDPRLRGTA